MHPPRRRPGAVHISAPSFSTAARTSVYRKIAYVFLALTIAIITLVLWLTSVRADVIVRVKKESVRLDGVVEVSKTPRAGQIPGRVLQGVFDRTQEFQVMDSAEDLTPPVVTTTPVAPVTPPPVTNQEVIARGKVKIVNKYSKDQPLVKTTRLLTADGKLYRIDKTITVPSGGSVTVDVYADQPGADFAIGPTNFTIPGLYIDLQKHIYGVSEVAFTAVPRGTVESSQNTATTAPAPIVSTGKGKPVTFADIDRAEKQLTEAVLKKATETLTADIANRESLQPIVVYNVVEKKSNVTIGQVTESFLTSVKLDVTIIYYAQEDMQSLIRSRMKERIPQGREFVPADIGNTTYALESSDPQSETATIRISADSQYRLSPQSALLQPTVITGKTKAEAEAILKAVDGVDSVTIIIKPQWLDTIPTLKDRIHLTVE